MFKKIMIVFVAVILLVIGYIFIVGEITIPISRATIQKGAELAFPIEENFKIASITATNPKVIFVPETNRINLKVTVKLDPLGKTAGKALSAAAKFMGKNDIIKPFKIGLEGKLKYENASIYFQNFKIIDLGPVPKEYLKLVQDNLPDILMKKFNKTPLYTLDSKDSVESLVMSYLKDIKVEEETLKIIIGLL